MSSEALLLLRAVVGGDCAAIAGAGGVVDTDTGNGDVIHPTGAVDFCAPAAVAVAVDDDTWEGGAAGDAARLVLAKGATLAATWGELGWLLVDPGDLEVDLAAVELIEEYEVVLVLMVGVGGRPVGEARTLLVLDW